jgi:hypothetical protein
VGRQEIDLYGIEADPDLAAGGLTLLSRHSGEGSRCFGTKISAAVFRRHHLSTVLENVKHPDEMLRRIYRCLKHDGKIVVAVPNVVNWYIRLCLLFGRFDYQERGILDRTHLRFSRGRPSHSCWPIVGSV